MPNMEAIYFITPSEESISTLIQDFKSQSLYKAVHVYVTEAIPEQLFQRLSKSEVAKKMKLSVRFKTGSVKKKVDGKTVKTGEYRYFSAVSLNVAKMHEEAENMLGSGLLTEADIKGWVQKQWNRLKATFKKIIAYIKQSMQNLLDFLQVEPVIRVNTTVRL